MSRARWEHFPHEADVGVPGFGATLVHEVQHLRDVSWRKFYELAGNRRCLLGMMNHLVDKLLSDGLQVFAGCDPLGTE
jgi:hypothetical protein